MNTNRLDLYKEAIQLETERAKLEAKLDGLDQRLVKIQASLFESSRTADLSSELGKVPRITRSPRGALTERVLQLLSEAGPKGISVPDIANALGVKPANVHAWFQQSGKKHPQIKKVGRGIYSAGGSIAVEAPAKRAKTGMPGRRGGLAAKITQALTAAGAAGIKLKELAAKLGVKYANLSVWFATTGKKNPAIKKVGEAHYRIE